MLTELELAALEAAGRHTEVAAIRARRTTRQETATVTTGLRFQRQPDPAPGVRAYLVLAAGAPGTPEGILGTVTNRRGGWWRATTDRGEGRGSFHHTRAAAAAALTD